MACKWGVILTTYDTWEPILQETIIEDHSSASYRGEGVPSMAQFQTLNATLAKVAEGQGRRSWVNHSPSCHVSPLRNMGSLLRDYCMNRHRPLMKGLVKGLISMEGG